MTFIANVTRITADWLNSIDTAVTALRGMANQEPTAVNIDGGAIDATPIGATTPSTGAFTTLSATQGLPASDVTYTPAGTGAVATDVQTQLRNIQAWYVNVKDAPFYAAGDGVTDDTAAIQAAIDSLGSDGGTVYFPKGNYKYTQLTIENRAQSYITLQGDGREATSLLCYGTAGTYGIIIKGNDSNVLADTITDTTIRDMRLYGTNAAAGTSAVLLQNCQRTIFDGVWFSQWPRHGLVLHRPSGGHHAYTMTHRCIFSGNGNSTADSWGVYTDVATSDPINDYLDVRSVFTGNGEYAIATPTGGNIKSEVTNLVMVSTTLNSSGYGAWFYRCYGSKILAPRCEGNTLHNIYLDTCKGTNVEGGRFYYTPIAESGYLSESHYGVEFTQCTNVSANGQSFANFGATETLYKELGGSQGLQIADWDDTDSGGHAEYSITTTNPVSIRRNNIEYGSQIIGTSGTSITQHIRYKATSVAWGSIAANTSGTVNVTVSGAAGDDNVFVNPTGDLQAGLTWCAYVSGANTVTIKVSNATTGALTPTTRNWIVNVVRGT